MLLIILFLCSANIIYARPDVAFLKNNGYDYNRSPNDLLSTPLMQQALPSAQRTMNFQPSFSTDTDRVVLMQPPKLNPLQDSYQAAYQHSGILHDSGYAAAMPQTQVHKHVYVHVPPQDFDDDEAVQPQVYRPNNPRHKHYKIVFIKTPMASPMRPAIVQAPPQIDEKTLIYVLHKKPEAQQDIIFSDSPPTTPSKPEVFFVKYKTKKEGAPVYGPPPNPAASEPRQGGSSDITADYLPAADAANREHMSEMTTMPPVTDNQNTRQNEYYSPPTMPTHEDTSVTMPSNLYLPTRNEPSKSSPNVDNASLPVARYGPPNSFFFKH